MSETRWVWWFIWTAAACFFCLSWQRVYGAARAQGLATDLSFATPAWSFDLPLAESSRCQRLSVYQSPSDQASISIEGEATTITATADSLVVSWLILPECEPDTTLRWPFRPESIFSEKPQTLAKVSGAVGANFTVNGANLDLFLLAGREPIELKFLLSSANDQVELGLVHTSVWSSTPPLNSLELNSWGNVFTTSVPESGGLAGLEYRVSSMLSPTPNQTQPLTDCFSKADLFFSQPATRCWQLPGQTHFLPTYPLVDQHLFALSPGGALSSLDLPPTVKPTQAGEVVISEVMWAGSFAGEQNLSTDEWLELANTTGHRFNLRGAKIERAVLAGNTLLINVDLVIEPYGYVVIGRLASAKTQLVRGADWITSSLSLSNDQAELVLRAQNGVELDRTPSGGWQAGRNDTARHQRASAQRQSLNKPGNDWSNWGTCAADSPACLAETRFWRSLPGQNQATPWQPTVL